MLIILIIISFLLAAVFGILWFLNRSPHSYRAASGYMPPSFQPVDTFSEQTQLEATSIHVPDVFNESRIKADLEVLATRPTLLAQYIAQAELRFTQGRQMAVLKGWIDFYKVGKEVITARTDLIRAHHDFLHINREGKLRLKKRMCHLRGWTQSSKKSSCAKHKHDTQEKLLERYHRHQNQQSQLKSAEF